VSPADVTTARATTRLAVGACGAALISTTGAVSELRARLTAHLKTRALLLVLDNFEHLQPGAPEVRELLKQAPHVKVLVTSRAPLHLEGERVLHVDGLGLPSNAVDLESAEASALFLQEARRVQVGYSLPAEQRPHLVEMCHQLGGFPLALVLAARWAPVLQCTDIVRELGSSLDVLATSGRPAGDIGCARARRRCPPVGEGALWQSVWRTVRMRRANGLGVDRSVGGSGLGVLSDQALVWIDSACGTPRLHPPCRARARRAVEDQRVSLPEPPM
jgi:hypothetical protein